MITSTSKKILLLFISAAFLFSFSTTKAYQTNFSGTWALNESKSELGQFGGRAAPSKMTVDQKGNDVTFTRTGTSPDGNSVSTTETITGDGKVSETTLSNAGKKSSTLKWAADGTTFTINSTISIDANGQAFTVTVVENWSLSADGKTLTLDDALTTPQGDINIKAVYDKQ